MGRSSILTACCLGAVVTLTSGAEHRLNEARSTLEKWVETKQLIARTAADWRADQEMLVQTRVLFERELQSIQEQMSKLSTNSTQVEKERVQAEELQRTSQESLAYARQLAARLESDVVRLVPQLPAPLQDLAKPLLNRIPADPTQTRLSAAERVQVIVGILNEFDKFNSGVNIFHEKRTNAKGEEVAVDVVYVGVAAAYFVNSAGDLAGLGRPGVKGWEWTIDSSLAPAVREVVSIYRNERTARFVPLPVVIR